MFNLSFVCSQCVAVCPSGTTALISSIRAKIRSQTSKNYAREELRCELCSPTCAECLRPRSEYDCTACSGDTYLAPLLSPNKPMPSTNPSIARLISSATAVRGSKLLVGSCVPRCPSRYFANRTSKICEQYACHLFSFFDNLKLPFPYFIAILM